MKKAVLSLYDTSFSKRVERPVEAIALSFIDNKLIILVQGKYELTMNEYISLGLKGMDDGNPMTGWYRYEATKEIHYIVIED